MEKNMINLAIISIMNLKIGKGFIKENHFDFNKYLIFEGEYSNGERNGKGKEYYSGEKNKI